jgi:exopolyphosphatase/pppGpp-phosphohydrolase
MRIASIDLGSNSFQTGYLEIQPKLESLGRHARFFEEQSGVTTVFAVRRSARAEMPTPAPPASEEAL